MMVEFDKTKAKILPLKNYNNCLACDAFLYISFAPRKVITDEDMERIYYTEVEEFKFYSKIVDIYKVKFSRMPSLATIPATGMEGHEWEKWWLQQYPQTNPDTEMAVYFYKKIK